LSADPLGTISFGPLLAIDYSSNTKNLVDNDGSGTMQKIRGVLGSGGLSTRIAKVLSVTATGNGGVVWGDYYGYTHQLDADIAMFLRRSNGRIARVMSQSANPNSHAARLWHPVQKAIGYTARISGMKYVCETSLPPLSKNKLLKGYANASEIESLAKKFSNVKLASQSPVPNDQEASLGSLISKSYKPVAELLDESVAGVVPPLASLQVHDPALGITLPAVSTDDGNEIRFAPRMVFNALTKTFSLPVPATGKTPGSMGSIWRSNSGGELETGLFLNAFGDNPSGIRSGIYATGSWDLTSSATEFQRAKAMHEQLDPTYTNDVVHSEDLLEQLEGEGQSASHYLKEISKTLGNSIQGTVTESVPGENAELKKDIEQKFGRQYLAISTVFDQYKKLVTLSASLKTYTNKNKSRNSDEYRQLTNDIKAFTQDLFGKDNDAILKSKHGEGDAFIENPEYFMAVSYDALSVCLGKIGVDIFRNKERLTERSRDIVESLSRGDLQELSRHRRHVDRSYSAIRGLMNDVHLPIDRELLLREASALGRSTSRYLLSTAKAEAIINLSTGDLLRIPGNTRLPSITSVGSFLRGHSADNNITGNLEAATAGVGVRVVKAEHESSEHPNPGRQGIHRLQTVAIGGEGIIRPEEFLKSIEAAKKLATAAVSTCKSDKKLNAYVGKLPAWMTGKNRANRLAEEARKKLHLTDNEDGEPREYRDAQFDLLANANQPSSGIAETPTTNQSDAALNTSGRTNDDWYWINHAAKNLVRTEVSEISGEIELLTSFREPLPTQLKIGDDTGKVILKDVQYQESPQWFRLSRRKTSKWVPNIGIPIPILIVPFLLRLWVSRTTTDVSVLREYLGTCPAYQVMSFPEIEKVIDEANIIAAKNSSVVKTNKDLVASHFEDLPFATIQKLLMRTSAMAKLGWNEDPANNAEFVLNKFFGMEETVLGYLDNYSAYQTDRREFGREADENGVFTYYPPADRGDDLRSDYDRVDDNPLYWTTLHTMGHAKKFAPSNVIAEEANDNFWGERPISSTNKLAHTLSEEHAARLKEDPQFSPGNNEFPLDDPRPTLTDGELELLKRSRNATKGMSAEQRMSFFMGTQDGKRLFSAYCRINKATSNINEALKSRHTYKSRVTHKEQAGNKMKRTSLGTLDEEAKLKSGVLDEKRLRVMSTKTYNERRRDRADDRARDADPEAQSEIETTSQQALDSPQRVV
jgi:hypothetical protein